MYLKKVNLIVLVVLTVSFLLIATAGVDDPRRPQINSPSQGNFWVNYTWSPGVNTDSFNVSVNGIWTNGTKDLFKYTPSSPHGWVFISVAGYNASLQPSLSSFADDHTQIKNNPITLTNVSGSYSLKEGETLYIDANYADADNDTGTFATTATNGTFNTSTGVLIWKPRAEDGRKYTWSISVDDGYGSKKEQTFTVTRNDEITLTNVSDRYFFNEGDILYIKPGYTDADNDTGIFATNAITQKKNVKFNSSSGELLWKTEEGDGGVYNWYINVTDGYGSISTQQFKVIIPLSISIQFKEPAIINDKEQWIAAKAGHIGKKIGAVATFKNTGEDSLNLTFTAIYNNTRTTLTNIPIKQNTNDSYRHEFEINSSGVKNGLFNYTFEIEVNGFKEVQGLGRFTTFSYRNTTNISLPIIPIFKIKRSNADGVLVSEGMTTPPIIYTLEANSSVNLTNISIYDPFYPEKYFNISKLEVNNSKNICWNNGSVSCKQNYTYQATTNDLSPIKCEGGYPCIINLATFTGKDESGGWINDTEYLEITVNRFPVSSSASSSSRGSGGGGGGGGLPPSEDFNNIEKREVREKDVFFGSSAAYVFTEADPVKIVSFESSVSQGEVPVAVEVLKNRSKQVGQDVPGHLYKYFNIFVGTSGFSKKVSNGVVFFSVNNSWLKNNGQDAENIKLYKWNGSWVEKNTEIVERRENSTYYASLTGNFSSFAIAGIKKPEEVKVSIDELKDNSSQTNSSGKDVKQPGNFNTFIWIIAIIGITSIIYYLKRIKLK